MSLTICRGPSELARAAARCIADLAQAAVDERGRFAVALSGGSTPRQTYETLATPPYRDAIPWSAAHVFWSDERCVPPDHADSNYRLARLALLDRVPLPAENVHRIQGELPPEDAAQRYEAELRLLGDPPVLDLALLGLGADGHTASLFPGAPRPRAGAKAVAVYAEAHGSWRVTLTLEALNLARRVLFLVSGEDKAAALAATLEGPNDPVRWPAQAVHGQTGEPEWLVDEAAASLLRGSA